MFFSQRFFLAAAFAGLIALPLTARAGEPLPLADIPSIAVTGYAHEWRVPDEAHLTLALTGNGSTPDAAIKDLTPAIAKLVDIVRQAGIPDGDTESIGPDIAPLYRHVYDAQGHEIMEKREPNGFRATYKLIAKTKSTETLGKLVPQVTAAGATIEGIGFAFSDETSIRLTLEEKAVADAVARARRQIAAAGAKPGRILSIGELGPQPPEAAKMVRFAMAPAATAMPAPDLSFALRPGKQEIAVERQVVMEILQY